ncbi:hypothetical protein NLU13_0160 [Sarocladium strictum]|uniref:Protein kinase domain-containing protein n=1 Tax=Sarocladium strictum TaxID=5046 RepID=A0AA39GPA3_SARSR|nr:hypothetical protein NLU13_0160 [Sarocladium strictum]
MSRGRSTQATAGLSAAEINERFRNLCTEIPGLDRYTKAKRVAVLWDEIKCRKTMLSIIEGGLDDLWLPISKSCVPETVSSGALHRCHETQCMVLSDSFVIPDKPHWPGEHANLGKEAISSQGIPKSVRSQQSLVRGGFGDVEAVKCRGGRGGTYALKTITRKTNRKEALEQMDYIKKELEVLRKVEHRHYVKLVASYTEPQRIGILMYPVADCNLGDYLDDFAPGEVEESVLAGFFGCLASALQHLHITWRIRHKDIKPQNILVIAGERNVLFTDFGLALDWSESNHTTTKQEQLRSLVYCPPEVQWDEERNSNSDVWSLGCVFLEMAAVLKGKKRKYIHDILTRGGRKLRYWNCLEDIEEVISGLWAEPSNWGNEPLVWVREMLKEDKSERLNSRQLRTRILEAKGFRERPFFGPCCKSDTQSDDEPEEQDVEESLMSSMSARAGQSSGSSQEARSVTAQVYDSNINQWRRVQLLIFPQALENWISAKTAADLALGGNDAGEIKSWRFESHVLTSHRRATITLSVEGKGKSHQSDFWITDAGVATSFELLAGPELTSWLGRDYRLDSVTLYRASSQELFLLPLKCIFSMAMPSVAVPEVFSDEQQKFYRWAMQNALREGKEFENVDEVTAYLRTVGFSESLLTERYLKARFDLWLQCHKPSRAVIGLMKHPPSPPASKKDEVSIAPSGEGIIAQDGGHKMVTFLPQVCRKIQLHLSSLAYPSLSVIEYLCPH